MKNRSMLLIVIGLLPILLLTALTQATADESQKSLAETTAISLNDLQSDTLFIHGVVSPTMQGVTVVLINGNGSAIDGMQTDIDGRFEFSDVPDGVYQLGIWDNNDQPVDLGQAYLIDRDNALTAIIIELPQVAINGNLRAVDTNNGTLKVTVKAADSENAIDATVWLYDIDNNESYSSYFNSGAYGSGIRKAIFNYLDTESTYRIFIEPGSSKYLSQNYNGVSVPSSAQQTAEFTEVTFPEGETEFQINTTVETTGIIIGQFVDAETNLPVQGRFYLSIGENSNQSIQSDWDGAFKIDRDVFPGLTTIHVSQRYYQPGPYAPGEFVIEAAADMTTTNVLIPLQKSGVVTGQVTKSDGSPIQGAEVAIYNSDENNRGEAYTDSDGVFTISEGLGNGSYFIKVNNRCFTDDDCYQGIFYGGSTGIEDSIQISVTENLTTTDIDFVLEKLPVIRGTLKASDTDEFVRSNIYLSDIASTYYSSEYLYRDEEFVFSVPPGTYNLQATTNVKPYIGEFYDNKNRDNADPITVSTGDDISVEFTLDIGGSISGTITDGQTGLPISGARITLQPEGDNSYQNIKRVSSDSDGNYHIVGLEEKTYFLSVEESGYGIFYSYGKSSDVNKEYFLIEENSLKTLDVALQPYAEITGKVQDAKDGSIIEGAQISIKDNNYDYNYYNGATFTGLDGTYEMRLDANRLTENTIVLVAQFPCSYREICIYTDSEIEIDIQNGEIQADVNFTLDRKAIIKGRITDEATGNLLNAHINVYKKLDSVSNGFSNVATFHCTPGYPAQSNNQCDTGYSIIVDAGTYYMQAYADGFVSEFYDNAKIENSIPITVSLNEEITIDYGLYTGNSISGKVIDQQSNLPLSNIEVRLYNSQDPPNQVGYRVSDANGNFDFGGLFFGDYYLQFDSKGSYVDEYFGNVQELADSTPITVVKGEDSQVIMGMTKGAELEVFVTDIDTGLQVANANITLYREDGTIYSNLVRPLNENGAKTIKGIQTGTYYLRIQAHGYVSEYFGQANSLDQAVPIYLEANEKESTIFLVRKTSSLEVNATVAELDLGNSLDNINIAIAIFQIDEACGGRRFVRNSSSSFSPTSEEISISKVFTGLNPDYTYEAIINYKGKNNYSTETIEDIKLVSGEETQVSTILQKGGLISGGVFAADTNDPLSDVLVSVYKQSIVNSGGYELVNTARTNTDGNYAVGGLTTGSHFVTFETNYARNQQASDEQGYNVTKDYASEIFNNIVQLDGLGQASPTPVNVFKGEETVVNVELEKGGKITGYYGSNGDYITASAYVKTDSGYKKVAEEVSEDSSRSNYTISGLLDGEYYLKFDTSSSYYSSRNLKTVWYGGAQHPEDSTPITIVSGETVESIDETLEEGAYIRGSLKQPARLSQWPEGSSSTRIYTQVSLYDENGDLVQTASGSDSYYFNRLWAGTYYVFFHNYTKIDLDLCGGEVFYGEWYGGVSRFENATPIIVTGSGEDSNININGTLSLDNPPPSLPNQPPTPSSYKVEGNVSTDGQPLLGVSITTDNGENAITNSDGDYVLYLQDGSHTITPAKNGVTFSPENRTIVVDGADIDDQDFIGTTLPTGIITGTVSEDESNVMLEGVDVLAYAQNGSVWQFEQVATTDANGNFQLANLAPADYKLLFRTVLQTHRSEYYDDAKSFTQGNIVTIVSNGTLANIDASLERRPEAAIIAAGIASYTNPDTGKVTLTASRGARERVTISRNIICEGDDPSGVQLIIGSKAFNMTSDDSGLYTVKLNIPGDVASSSNQNMSVQYVCNGLTETISVGELVLYDPSGVVTNAETGKPLVGANVTLYRVADALPDTGSTTNDCRTIDTRPIAVSSFPFGAWSGVPAADISAGHPVDAAFDNLNGQALFSPAVPTQVTGEDGKYGWDVAEGCWYVVVEAEGFETIVSPMVGVPPAVLDLDIALGEPASPPPPLSTSYDILLPLITR